MKKITTFALLAALVFVLFPGCGDGICLKSKGEMLSYSYDNLRDFTELELTTNGTVTISRDSIQSVRVETYNNIKEHLIVDVAAGRLFIGSEKCILNQEDLTVYVTLPEIEKVVLSGSGDISGTDLFDVPDFSASLPGSGNITMQVNTDNLDVRLSGSGKIELDADASTHTDALLSGSGMIEIRGETYDQEVRISGSGNYKCFGFNCSEANVSIPGSGNAELWVQDVLNVDISGSGNVFYIGQPDVNETITGSGRVVNSN